MTVENTFGHWKGRFPRFSKSLDMVVDGAVEVVAAACVIHNICEMRKEPYFVEWLQESFEQPEEEVIQVDELPGCDARDTLAALCHRKAKTWNWSRPPAIVIALSKIK